MPERIQLKRERGWRMPEGAVKVDRTTKFGNPFKPGQALKFPYDDVFGPTVTDAAHAVAVFAAYARITSFYETWVQMELRGKDLACWCKPSDPCHADVLLEIANREEARG